MVQASSFLLLLAFSAVMIQGVPLAGRSKEHHTKDKAPAEESKSQIQDGGSGSPQSFGQQASSYDSSLTQPFVQEGPPLGTEGTGSAPSGPSAPPATCMEPQTLHPAAQLAPTREKINVLMPLPVGEPVPEPPTNFAS
ncbi:hypothetical protein BCR42DRAFT_397890 [Absidia repens]|uniref:Uncharacterized protein n=1 Tax=Absidia repens TaxID=90262 RepID=A0A1X2HZV8_9FUNG|nr:hypothetical protein BCR42DRAFT_397890 [Absidia repens]